jgi:hypothetical protein
MVRFNEGVMDPVHGTMGPVHAFFLRKINLEIWKITEALDFFTKTTRTFLNYILVPVILHLGP